MLPDGPRQILAGLVAGLLFLGLYLGLSLVWWAALALAVAGYFALLLVVRRKPPSTEVMVGERVSQADLQQAAALLLAGNQRLAKAAAQAPTADRAGLETMASHVLSIRSLILADPNDYRMARLFVDYYLPRIVEAVESYVALAKLSQTVPDPRLADLGARIRDFGGVVEKIDRACIENDFDALESEVEALGFQLKRVAGVPQ